ncbi:hypothetical protein [Scytonema sp. NUACC21]
MPSICPYEAGMKQGASSFAYSVKPNSHGGSILNMTIKIAKPSKKFLSKAQPADVGIWLFLLLIASESFFDAEVLT